MTAVLITAKVLILVLLWLGMYLLIKAIRAYEPLQKVREKMDELDRQRLLPQEEKSRLQRYLDRLDEKLIQSGIKKILPRAGVEIWFLFNVLEFTLIFCLMGEGILIPILTAFLGVYLNSLILDILRFRNKRITEKHLLEFLNLFSDYSLSESEITMLLYRCGLVLPQPLKGVLVRCHLSARSTGDTEAALYEVRRSIDHFLFQEIILLLELCSHSDNDYQKVINGCREMVGRYLKEEKEKAAVVRSLIGEAALMTGVSVYGIATMLREFAGDAGFATGMGDFFFHHPAGQVCLLIYGVLIFAMVQVILKFSKGR